MVVGPHWDEVLNPGVGIVQELDFDKEDSAVAANLSATMGA